MSEIAVPLLEPKTIPRQKPKPEKEHAAAWLVICWNDPVNLMVYVTHVFQTVFGWNKEKAEKHMKQVHNDGKSILVRTTMEKAEHYVHELQKYTLHATMESED